MALQKIDNAYQVFACSPIFHNIEKDKAIEIIKKNSSLIKIKKGDTISLSKKLSCLTKGKANVSVLNSDKTVVRQLCEGAVFGCAVLFGGEAVSHITALCDCELVTVSEEKMSDLFLKEPTISLNYIRLLSEKIRFLNKRLSDFTSGSVEERLYLFLKKAANEEGAVKTSMTLLAKNIGVGRTSLYRALTALEEQSLITKDKNTIYIVKE